MQRKYSRGDISLILIISSFLFVGVSGKFGHQQQSASAKRADLFHDASSKPPMSNGGLKEYFESVLELRKEIFGNGGPARNRGRTIRGHVPLYVQNLYDRLTLESEWDDQAAVGRQRRSVSGESFNFAGGDSATKLDGEPVTIQAMAREEHYDEGDNTRRSHRLRFNLDTLWISNKELQLAELVLTVDYSHLASPPSAYAVYAYAVDESAPTPALRTRLLVSAGSLGILDTFRNNFVKLKVTDAVMQKVLAGSPRSILFEIFVSNTIRNGTTGGSTSPGRDLTRHEIGKLFHLSSRGSHQPLLVLYSSVAASIEESSEQLQPQTRRRRSVGAAQKRCGDGDECCLHEWWIDLVELFRDDWPILMPQGFYANFCAGQCRHPMYDRRWNATGNAQLRATYNGFRRQQAGRNTSKSLNIPNVTCVAQSPSPITVVYKVAAEGYIIRQLDSMMVHSCMCA